MDKIDKDFLDLKPNKNLIRNIIIAVSIVLLVGLSLISTFSEKDPLKDVVESNLVEIDMSKFYELYNSDEKFVLLLGRPDCSHCVAFKPVITKFANDNNIKVYYLDVYTIDNEDDWYFVWDLVMQDGTPALGIIENQKLVDSKSGELTKDELKIWFLEEGVL